jgi:hypothetical protein
MTLVVLGLDALDPELVDPDEHPALTLAAHDRIDTIVSAQGEPSTHELWPTIITGLAPRDHGLLVEEGVSWSNPLFSVGSRVADYLLPDRLQTALGAYLLNATEADAFRTPASYYADHGLETVFDGRESLAIGVPNYVTESGEDREHALRRSMGELFERDPEATGGHRSADPETFYEQCLEMLMVRVARTRRGLLGRRHELVFGYTSGLDLVGHVAYGRPGLQDAVYREADRFVAELRDDLGPEDDLLLVSDHGLQEGLHTDEAMVAATAPALVEAIDDVRDVKAAIDDALAGGAHRPDPDSRPTATGESGDADSRDAVREQLEDLGYM